MSTNAKMEIAVSDIINCEKLHKLVNTYSGLIKMGLSDKQATLFMMVCNNPTHVQSVLLEQPQLLKEKEEKSGKVKRKEKRTLAKKQSKLKMTC